jgi:membrane-bound ClpP family serine protease
VRFAGLRRLGLWWVVAALVVIGVGLIVFASRLRLGGFVIGLGLLIAAVLRLLVKEPRGGGIEVRSRVRDVVTLVVAAALVFGAFFLVRTCAPVDAQIGGGRAANCPPSP